jgi:hypothetical protein
MLSGPIVAPIVALVITLSVGGIGIAQGSSHLSTDRAKAAKGKKKRHKLDAEFKTGPLDVLSEGEFGADYEGSDEAKLLGRPFGTKKAHLDERLLFTYNQQGQIPQTDYSGTGHVTFDADVIGGGKFHGTFRGFYDYSTDVNGQPSGPVNGRITGGSRMFKGAKGSFTVLDLRYISSDPAKLAGRWKGFIRY